MKYWYEFRLRGLSPDAQPKGFVDSDPSYGKFGAVAYDKPLAEEEMEEYELTPLEIKGEKQVLDFNQELTIICKEGQGEDCPTYEVMTVEKWTKEEVVDFLEKIEDVGKLEVTQETDRGMVLTDGNIEFMIVDAQIVANARNEEK